MKVEMSELYKRLLTGFTLALLIIASLLFASPPVFVTLVALCMAIILFTEWPRLFHYTQKRFWLLLPVYPFLPFLLIILMQLQGYEIMNILLITLVAGHDAGSYIIGKLFGKHKISPLTSPSKTWEGFIGGTLLTFLLSLIFFKDNSITTLLGIILPFTVTLSFAALAGDMFESYLKRRAQIKDSGSLLPGHGGILDRVDSLMFAAIIVYALRRPLTTLLS